MILICFTSDSKVDILFWTVNKDCKNINQLFIFNDLPKWWKNLITIFLINQEKASYSTGFTKNQNESGHYKWIWIDRVFLSILRWTSFVEKPYSICRKNITKIVGILFTLGGQTFARKKLCKFRNFCPFAPKFQPQKNCFS